MSIAGLDVNVEPNFDLNAIGILNADIAQGRRHPFGLSRSADVAAVVQIDFNNKPVPSTTSSLMFSTDMASPRHAVWHHGATTHIQENS